MKVKDYLKKNIMESKENETVSQTSKTKGIVFLGFYLLIFLALAISARVNNNKPVDIPEDNTLPYTFYSIDSNNYEFTYTIVEDNNSYIYEGKKLDNSELFTYTNKNTVINYYREKSNFLKKENNEWINTPNPYKYLYFLDSGTISDILGKSNYISKTEYTDGMLALNYQVTTTELIKLMEDLDIDISDIPNNIVLTTNDIGDIYKIEFDLTGYGIYKKLINNKLLITLEYKNIGSIEEITR